ncbi:MAG TPA: hypothetical protein VHT34_12405 [Clostridia bacterium]|nr:hypothetical protein [Clostridia bacterium]
MSQVRTLFDFMESPVPPAIENSVVVKMFVDYLRGKTEGSTNSTSYRDVYFPGYTMSAGVSSALETFCPGDYRKWMKALICQTLYHYAPFKDIISYGGVEAAVTEMNNSFSVHAADLYIYYIRTFKGIQADESNKTEYRKLLTGNEWRTMTAAKQKDGNWNNPSWEMYCHWVKFSACGAGANDIAEVFQEITSHEPKISLSGNTDIHPGTWRQYGAWRYGSIDYSLANPQNLTQTYRYDVVVDTTYTGAPIVDHRNAYYSSDYIESTPWYHSSSGSCFTAGTKVVMYDGTLKNIEDIKPSDEILSPNGIRKVAFVSKPLRRGRSLYSINGCRSGMTCTQPVLNADTKDYSFVFIDPWAATSHIPLFKAVCSGKLREGSKMVFYNQGSFRVAQVEMIWQENSDRPDEILYDLILEQDGSPYDCYIVGDEAAQFVVCSEIPPMSLYPFATLAFINMLKACEPALRQIAQRTGRIHYLEHLTSAARSAGPWLMTEAARRTVSHPQHDADNIHFDYQDSIRLFHSPEGEYDYVMGIVTDTFSAHFADYLPGEIEMGWRKMDSCTNGCEVLAISIYNVSVIEPYVLAEDEKCTLTITSEEDLQIMDETPNKNIPASPFLRNFFSCAYLLGPDISSLRFTLKCGNEEFTGAVQIAEYNETLPRCFMTSVLRDGKHSEAAHVSLDMRWITPQQKKEEQIAENGWTDGQKEAFALTLGNEAGRMFGSYLTQTVLPEGKENGIELK